MFDRFKELMLKTSLVLVMICFLFVSLVRPQTAQAQLAVLITEDLTFRQQQIEDSIFDSFWEVAVAGLIQGVSYFLNKVAYDLAVGIATAGKGETPLIFQDPWGEYLESTASDAFFTAISEWDSKLQSGFICNPGADARLFINIGLQGLFLNQGPPTPPACNWQTFKGNWQSFYERQTEVAGQIASGNLSSVLEVAFVDSLSITDSDFGIALDAYVITAQQVAREENAKENERLEGDGFKSVTDLITGEVRTPAQFVKEETNSLTSGRKAELQAGQALDILGSGSLNSLLYAGNIFINTLVSELINRVLEDGLFPSSSKQDTDAGGFGIVSPQFGSFRQQAQAAFNFYFTSTPQKQLQSFDVITAFAACPENPGGNNCVMDTQFQEAVQRAKFGNAFTIADALEEGLLDANKPLISPRRVSDNQDFSRCYQDGYCYYNLQKMRKVGIIPLGFEVAALIADPDNPQAWTLGKVVDGFEDCARDSNGNAISDPAHPFCHLIDPNWVLRVHDVRCENKVFTDQLRDPTLAFRHEECVDISQCVNEGPNGECLGNYGYCLKEKNIWRIGGDACPAQFATCKTYQDRDGELASLLERTVDFGSCGPDNVGCRAYSLEQENGKWISHVGQDLTMTERGRTQVVNYTEEILGLTCSSDAEGCTAFYHALPGGKRGQLVHLQKAPDYLGCYDSDPTTTVIEWPSTTAEVLNSIPQGGECAKFAQACIPGEVGCEGYTPLGGGPEIPGVIGSNACAAVCVGYDTFKQEETVFSPQEFPLYFVPDSGTACLAEYEGCDEFTNLDASGLGGESLEYYTDLKYCEKPTGDNEKLFYTWEGSSAEGFVLRTHRLRPNTADDVSFVLSFGFGSDVNAELAVVGAPSYVDDSENVLVSNFKTCNEDNYNALINNSTSTDQANSDCRAFFDDSGEIYYRLLADTVTVSELCHPLRKTESRLTVDTGIADETMCERKNGFWNGSSCERCYRGGNYEGGSCIYQTISVAGESNSCPAAANGCREYVGNTGANIRLIFNDSFEPGGSDADALLAAKGTWAGSPASNVRVVTEAPQVGLHSLMVDVGTANRTINTSSLNNEAFYELTFFARGAVQNITIGFLQNGANVGTFTFDIASNQNAPVTIGDAWKQYRLGPVQFTGNEGTPAELVFVRTGSGNYFIDDIELKEVQERIYLVKDSWQTSEGYNVPIICDANPTDNLPGAALGCSAYNDRQGNTINAVGFEKICRENAIGCQPFFDTYNTVDVDEPESAHAYKIWCPGVPGTTCQVELVLASSITLPPLIIPPLIPLLPLPLPIPIILPLGIGSSSSDPVGPECVVEIGQEGCYVDEFILPDGFWLDSSHINKSTIIIPVDTPTSTPIYLTAREEFQCGSHERGCSKVGLETQTLPGDHDIGYEFEEKFLLNDPEKYSETLCTSDGVGCEEFRTENSVKYFKDPRITGNSLCTYRDATGSGGNAQSFGWFLAGVGQCSNDTTILCSTDANCGEGNSCLNVDAVACYPDFLNSSGEFGIWSNKSAGYDGNVGFCSSEFNMCTELIDPVDTANTPEGEKYHVIFNSLITDKIGLCNGQVSLKDGCVLFNKTDEPNKLYNAEATYDASQNADARFSSVDPISDQNNDTNILLKVDRDRACSEWLACKTSVPRVLDTGSRVNLCYQFDVCSATEEGQECTNWANQTFDQVHNRLSIEDYVERDTSWYGEDFTGYSLLDKYPISEFAYITFDLKDYPGLKSDYADQSFLAYVMDSRLFAEAGSEALSCIDKFDFDRCGFNEDGSLTGICHNQDCIYPAGNRIAFRDNGNPDLQEDEVRAMVESFDFGICKGAPENDSPFSIDLAVESGGFTPVGDRKVFTQKRPSLRGANVCQEGECSCEYTKVNYKDTATADYWPIVGRTGVIPDGICVGGTKDGISCINDKTCTETDNGEVVSAGVCKTKDRVETHLGFRGYCLEYDRSRVLDTGVHPCLTWLPIDVSASNVDIFNASFEAGYVPPSNGGRVFCAAGTSAGQIEDRIDEWKDIVDTEWSLNGNNLNEIYEQFFEPDGKPQGSGFGRVFSPLGIEHLGDDPVAPDNLTNGDNLVYNRFATTYLMQVWGWHEIGTSAVLLRMDAGPVDSSKVPGDDKHGYVFDGDDIVPYSFAPEIPEGRAEFGTIFHPPPAIDRIPDYTNPDNYKVSLEQISNSNISRPDDGQLEVSPIFNAPGPSENLELWLDSRGEHNMGTGPVQETYLGVTETLLSEDQISAIYFVPMAFPGGADGTSPALFNKEFKIDFLALRASQEKAYVNTATGVEGDNNKSGYDADDRPDDNLVWSYVQEAGSSSGGITSFDEGSYFINGANGSGSVFTSYSNGTTAEEDRHIAIAKRYVAVFADNRDVDEDHGEHSDWMPQNNPTAPPNSTNNDPFSVECTRPMNDSAKYKGNWLAIGLDFNEDGEFLGYISRYCNQTKTSGTDVDDSREQGIMFATYAEMNNQCTDFVQVYDPMVNPLSGTTDKAWTNKLWENNPDTVTPVGYSLTFDDVVSPFSSLPIQDIFNRVEDSNGDISLSPNLDILLTQGFDFPQISGLPYTCTETIPFYVTFAGAAIPACAAMNAPQKNSNWQYGQVASDLSGKDKVASKNALLSLFAAEFGYAKRGTTGLGLSFDISGDFFPGGDFSEDLHETSNLEYPKVFSVNPLNCPGPNCEVGELNNITVNGKNANLDDNDGDGFADEDSDRNGVPDPIIGIGKKAAIITFFAEADDNTMPIRQVMVHWGDRSLILNEGKRGRYKNHKASCEGPGFGNSDDACIEQPFEFFHEYSCDSIADFGEDWYVPVEIATTDAGVRGRLAALGFELTDSVCKFKPRVQIMDNWDWCNSVDIDGNPAGKYGKVDCDPGRTNSFVDEPFTSFNGLIIVVPDQRL